MGDAAEVYIIYAHAVLPAIVPLGFTLLEPDRSRSRLMWPLVWLGLLLGVYLLWQITAYPVGAQPEARCIDYTTHTPNDVLIGVLYVAVTCGPALMSSRRYLRWFGLISLVGVIAVALVRADELTSLWCLYAALVSVLILEHFRRQRTSEAHRSPTQSGPTPLVSEAVPRDQPLPASARPAAGMFLADHLAMDRRRVSRIGGRRRHLQRSKV